MVVAMANTVNTMLKGLIDCHSHILPEVDDGSRNSEESLDILRQFKEQGIKTILATPHFYPDQNLEDFLASREVGYEKLMTAIEESGESMPGVLKGAEVLLAVDTPKLEGLDKLCIEGTRYILIELPYADWKEWVYEALYTIRVKHGLIPVMAHIERYEPLLKDIEKLNRLAAMEVVLQMNAYSLLGKNKVKTLAKRLVKNDMVQVLGSDVHRAKSAKSVALGYEVIAKEIGSAKLETMLNNAKLLVRDEKIDRPTFKPIKKKFGFYF